MQDDNITILNDSPERTELPGVIELLKSRWPEAVLVIAFHACLFMLVWHILKMSVPLDGTEIDPPLASQPDGWAFMIGFGIIVFLIVSEMLRLGFLRTVLTGGCRQTEPIELLKTGKCFFGRIVRFEIICTIAFIAIQGMLPTWIGPIAMVIMIKPLLLIPAIIVTCDCNVRKSFQSLKQFRLLGKNPVIALFMLSLLIQVFFAILLKPDSGDVSTGVQYFKMGIWAMVSSTLNLAITLAAVLFVANTLKERSELGGLDIDE